MMRIITAHNILKGFSVFACADISFLKNRSPKASNLALNGNFSILSLFCRPFLVTIATGKSKIHARILHLGYSSNKSIR